MATIDDDMKEDVDYSSLLHSLNSDLNKDAISLEDVAWADSCINKDVDSSNADWSSIKEALLEILVSQHGPLSSAVGESNGQPTENETLHSIGNGTSLAFVRRSDVDEDEDEDLIYDDVEEDQSIELSEDDEEDVIMRKRHGRVKGKSPVGSVFRPNYTEEVAPVEKLDSNWDFGLITNEMDPSSEDIFKVWDLGISDELDDFTKQLDKVLDESPSQSRLTDEDSTSWNNFTDVSVDDLVAGFGGLSLTPNSK